MRIYFLDNSSKMFLADTTTTVHNILSLVLGKLDLPTDIFSYYALYTSLNGVSIDRALDMEDKVMEISSKWQESPATAAAKFVFMIRLLVPSISGLEYHDVIARQFSIAPSALSLPQYLQHANVRDAQLMSLLYNQLVYSVITSLYPTTHDLALSLGAYHFLYKFGGYDASRHKVGFLGNRIVEFLPYKHLKNTDLTDWEQRLLYTIQDITASLNTAISATQAQVKYVKMVMQELSACYGCSFFRCSQVQFSSLPPDILLGIHHAGIVMFDKQRQQLRQYHLQEIARWGYKRGSLFYFEVKQQASRDGLSVELTTREGESISHLLTDYAAAFIREKDAAEIRSRAEEMQPEVIVAPPSVLPPPPAQSDVAVPEYHTNNENHTNHVQPPKPPPPPARPKSAIIPTPLATSQPSMTSSEHQETAAVKIQALYRGFALRFAWLKEECAIVIQACYRGYRARAIVSAMIEQLFLSGELRFDSDEEY